MLPVYTSEEMRGCDAAAISTYGIPGIVLMENAARGAVDAVEEFFGAAAGRWILIIAGKGNNGGDGFTMARHFVNRGADVDVFTLGPDTASTGDAAANLAVLRAMEKETGRLRVHLLSSTASLEDLLQRRPWLAVDAMLGTGLSSPVKGEIAEIIEVLNRADVRVMAVDIPTGINADTGDVMGGAVQADLTATMGGLKRGLLLRGGRGHAGEVRNIDIGIPREGYAAQATSTFLLDLSDIEHWLPRRSFDAHKYQLGSVFVLAGSIGLTGAAAMASRGALRSGAGIVHLGIPQSLNATMEAKLTEVMTVPCSETSEGSLSLNGYDAILERIDAATVSIIGPGISRQYETQNLVRKLIEHATAPLLLDADALYALSGHLDLLHQSQADIILTPHVGEFARLVSQSKQEIETKRIDIAHTFAVEFGVTLVLKGAPTVIATRDGTVYINSTGNPGMATAGAGDVLSGIIAGFAAQGCPASHAACLGVYLHGLAGDHAKKQVGEYGLIATDLLRSFAEVLRDITPPATREGM
ncbi:MAG: NAD(P)H-hydrate dehydratase [Bacteroidetes bacterium]|nr:NAD(P)H-hydrate dehydratase [Bacteroidota bacterium]